MKPERWAIYMLLKCGFIRKHTWVSNISCQSNFLINSSKKSILRLGSYSDNTIILFRIIVGLTLLLRATCIAKVVGFSYTEWLNERCENMHGHVDFRLQGDILFYYFFTFLKHASACLNPTNSCVVKFPWQHHQPKKREV